MEMNYYRRAAQYLGTDVLTLVERLEANPLYEQIVHRAFEASVAEQEAVEDMKAGKQG